MFFHHLVGECGDGPGDYHDAAVHRIETVGDLTAKIDVLFDEQDGERLFLLELLDGPESATRSTIILAERAA